MSGPEYDIEDANRAINELVNWVLAGADVVLSRDGQPVARVIPYVEQPDEQDNADITLRLRRPTTEE